MIRLLVRLVEEPAMDLAKGGIDRPVLNEKVHLGGYLQNCQQPKVMSFQASVQEVVENDNGGREEFQDGKLTRRLGGSQTR